MSRYLCLPLAAAMLVPMFAGSRAWGEEPNSSPTAPQVAEVRLSADDTTRLVTADVLLFGGLKTLSANGLGIDVNPAEPALRAQLGLKKDAGVVVTMVPEDSVGAKAGLKLHDVIVRIAETHVGDAAKLQELLAAADAKPVKLHVLRGGKPIELQATPAKPEFAEVQLAQNLDQLIVTQWQAAGQQRYRIGITLSEADDTLRTQLRLAAGEGLVVTEVVDDSPAAGAGVQQHDVLTVLDGKRLTTVDAINEQIQEIQDREVELRFLRGGREVSVQVAPRKGKDATVRAADWLHRYHDPHHSNVTLWNAKNCTSCHAQPFADVTTWRSKVVWSGIDADGFAPSEPQQQIDALKAQLGQMQHTLAALEAALKSAKPGDAPKEDQREQPKE